MKFSIFNFQFSKKKELGSSGYIAISTVVIILAVILALTITMSYSAIGEAQSGLSVLQGEENLQEAEGCVEDVMLKIRSNPVTVASVTRPEGTCSVNYTASGPTNWDMTVTFQSTTSTGIRRSIRVIFTRSATGLTMTSWNEI